MDKKIFFIITCEHGGNRIPSPYRDLFRGHESLLHTHRGYDHGALRVAREIAAMLSAPLVVSTVSRLLIDLNRSPTHPKLYSEATRPASILLRKEIYERYYRPYRENITKQITQAIGSDHRVIHLSCHSFTPELNGEVRNADIGLLYDPSRDPEASLCRQWKAALKKAAPSLKTRMNYPYAGTSDGFTSTLRKQFSQQSYIGIELEINQKHVLAKGAHWQSIRTEVRKSFHEVVQGK